MMPEHLPANPAIVAPRRPADAPVAAVGSPAMLPYGVGRFTGSWFAVAFLTGVLIVFGLFAYAQQVLYGESVTGMRDWGTMGGAPWALYIVFVVYFVGVSFAGITVAALIRLMRLDHLRPIARMAEVLTVIAIVLGAMSIVADLGQPMRGLVNLFRYARPQSPFFGTFTLVVAGYLFASLVYLFLDGRRDAATCARVPTRMRWFHRLWASGYQDTSQERARHKKASFWLALAILPLLITAHSTLGFVFGLQVGRPGWFSALQAPGFVVLAGVSGIGLLIIVAAAARRSLHMQRELGTPVFRWLGMFLLVLTLTYLYFMVVELLTTTYPAHHHELMVTEQLLWGRHAPMYWSAVAMLVGAVIILALQALSRRWSVGALVLAALLVNVAAVFKRFLIVVPSLTHGGSMPYEPGSYSPTWVEYGVVGGLIALGVFLFILFAKVFPLLPMAKEPEPEGGRLA